MTEGLVEAYQILPVSLSLLAVVVTGTSIYLLVPQLRVLVHKEHPLPGFLLYEICLVFGGNRPVGSGHVQVSFYLSLKKS
jgi:hypothetical protein